MTRKIKVLHQGPALTTLNKDGKFIEVRITSVRCRRCGNEWKENVPVKRQGVHKFKVCACAT